MDYADHRCLEASNFDVVDEDNSWTQSSSPWSTPQDCWWPLDTDDTRLCAFDGSPGNHQCEHDPAYLNESDFRWCGSDYDALGNRRFEGGVTLEGSPWGGWNLTDNATFVEDLAWGYTTFDNIFVAFLTIFQSITLEGWSDILYQVKDCSRPVLADLFFIVLVLWGAFFTLNLLLAVLENNFSQGKEEEEARQAAAAAAAAAAEHRQQEQQADSSIDDVLGASVEEKRSITTLIILNTLTLALDHHPMDEEFSTVLDLLNLVFTLCFALEMALKLVALGPRGYAKDKFNLFDGLVVLSSLVELAIWPPDILTGGDGEDWGGGLSALRSFRVLRILKLARGWSSMRDLLETLRKTLLDIGNFALLLLLFMFIYVLIGVQFFANRLHFAEDGRVIGIGEEGYYDAEVPRSNFDTLLHAFTTVFEVLSGENWNATMYSARRAVGWVSVFYFVSLIIVGMMIVMSLFLAILLSHFATPEQDEADAEDRERRDSPGTAAQRALRRAHSAASAAPFGSVGTRGFPHATGVMEEEEHAQEHHLTSSNNNNSDAKVAGNWDTDESPDNRRDGVDADADGNHFASEREENAGCFSWSRLGASVAGYAAGAVRSVKVPENIYPGFALCCLSAKNPLRRGCAAVVSNAGFSRLVTLLIVLSSLTVALDTPLRDPDSTAAEALWALELALTFLFVLECVLKVCASGFFFMPLAYLRDAWNVLDFGVVMVSVVQLFLIRGAGLSGLRSLRALRALRPLRIVKRFPGLKIVLEALIGSVQGVFNVAAVCFLFYIIFAILCVNYFKGLLMSCQGDAFDALPGEVVSFLEDPLPWSEMSSGQREWFGPLSNVSEAFSGDGFSSSIGGNLSTSRVEYCDVITGGLWPDAAACCSAWPTSAEEAPTSYEVCECLGLSWAETIPQQFDNVAVSLLTLFEISTTEAWTSVTYAAVDATGVGMQPIRDHVIARVWLFILFMLLGAYLVMNLFVGVIVDNFKKMKARAEEGGLLVTEHQRLWIKTQLIMRRLRPMKRPQPPPGRLGSSCFRLINLPWFDPAVMVCIVLNTVVLAMDYFGQSNLYTSVLELLLYVLYALFTLEALAKILALRWAYFKDPWNRFDFFIVLGSTAGLLSLLFLDSNYGTVITVIRTFRVGRVLRLVRGMGSMSQLFQTLLMTLPSMGNVGALLFLLFFIFAAMGVQLYAKVGLEGALNAQANFRSFWDTMVLLLRFSTGENWNGFMYDVAAERDGCRSDPEYDPDVCGFTSHDNCIPIDGCGSWTIYPYMISFTFLITFVFLNLFIGVILDGFDSAKEESDDFITEEDLTRFAEHWSNFDPHATCLMSVQDLHSFLQSLFKPWGFGVHYQASSRELRHKVRRLDLFVFDNNKVHFKDVLHALSEEVFRTEAEKKGEVLDYLQGSKRHQLKKARG
ncbi:similar to sodium channel, voltage-gated, type IX, alpha isoform 5 [Ectocarpus siliculosus]|uniref:Similar to sodium channel, voltage-gated, type IX, alpha isoform 5 n=1 Tax=Ectocarpus siliculosus TaxID=2880 RepID=D8LI93_ECTSI|nr:similar to sodium channel, voltage-gated, type IX, alpha isoform 5 [Ectocarpus siliculosus]|eukprot:CBN75915.1 similar to sodium channel, voltage-gated, type IX, alpha isoform 5 [Ectocarpus siliculosus]